MAPDAVALEDGFDILFKTGRFKTGRGAGGSLCRRRDPLLRAKRFLPGIVQLLFSLLDLGPSLSDQVPADEGADIRIEGFDRKRHSLDLEFTWGKHFRRGRIERL